MVTLLDTFNIAVSGLAGVGLLYLLYSGRYVVGYRRFFTIITFGLFLVVVSGSLLVLVSPAVRHGVHGLATLFIAIGLWDLARVEAASDQNWQDLLFEPDGQVEPKPPDVSLDTDD